ncbi:MAG: UDP-N-acetylgalactosamine-undecaprenyl-phosphate N-acetylgalactosaminephosphotransferase [Verrucomicrobia bacterium ADurb.Bin345]|nr:MAG: UDP-N-acetylgalactosamine-undecaprenyl-phosphate N-acetylgalactosaminephosphotransferase [Verrucomicrobia bacterium ADurb.Bin345]
MFFKPHMRMPPGRIFLVIADIFCIFASIILSAILRLTPSIGWAYVLRHLPSLLGSSLVFLVVFYAGGMYEQPLLERRTGSFVLSFVTTAIGLALVILFFYARFQLHIGRGILLLAGLFVCLSSWGVRQLYRTAVGYGLLSRNTLIVGEGKEAVDVLQLLSASPDAGFRVFGVVSCTKSRPGAFVEGIPVLGHMSRLREFADVYSIETIVVAASLAREHALLRLLRPLRYMGIEILDYVTLSEEIAQEIPLDHVDDEWLMNAAMNSSVIHIRKIKRVMDLTVSVLGLILLAPVWLIAALVIRLDSRGPVLYRQRRAGLEGHPYTLYKLRTMRQDAEASSGAVWADRYDSRITRVGRFLRKWRIDEIPQLINVLRGEMSLVGPRPERPEFIDTLAEAIPFYRERLLVPPGISGWAQVKYPYAASIEAARRKLQYDLYYIKHMSLFLDIIVLLRTFRTILVGLRHSDEFETEESGATGKVISIEQLNPGAEVKRAG